MSRPETMTIGKLAESAGVGVETVRFCLSGALPTSECPILDALEQEHVSE